MTGTQSRCALTSGLRIFLGAAALTCAANGLAAQDPATAPADDYLDRLKACRLLSDDAARLACFDRAVGEIVVANEAGDVRIIDREDVRQTRRELFGFTVPEVGILKDSNAADPDAEREASETLETSITSVRYFSNKKFRITTAEGAVWEISNAPPRLRTIEPGDKVVFKQASLGYYFVRINGQLGVKGKRVE